MSNQNRLEVKRQVIKFYNENRDKGKSYTVKHFANLGESTSCIYHYIREAYQGTTSNSSKRSPLGDITNTGRVTKKAHVPAKSILIEDFDSSDLSKRSDRLLATCRQRCGMIYEKFLKHDWILDNKCVFTYRCNQGSKFRTYYTFEGDTRPPPVIYEEDLLPRLFVWIAFSNQGISEPFIMATDSKFDTRLYYEKCLRARLLPFIKENHDLNQSVLWTDAGSVTSNKRVFDCLESENIKFVNKDENPGNRVRCCSYFWTLLKNAVYEDNWVANDDEELENRIRECLEKLNMNSIIRIANDTENRIFEMYQSSEIKQYSDNKQKYTRD